MKILINIKQISNYGFQRLYQQRFKRLNFYFFFFFFFFFFFKD